MSRALVIVKAGDPRISDAVESGIRTGREERLTPEQFEVVSAEIDRQHIARLVRVAVGNDKTPEDYASMVTKARGDYGTPARPGRVGRWLLQGYALVVLALAAAYRAQDKVLGRR